MEISAYGSRAVFAGTLIDVLQGAPQTRICLTDLDAGATRVLTFGPNLDRLPKFSPDGGQVAFLSDRKRSGDFQLHLLNPESGCVRATPPVAGWVEYLHWSPDGRRILLGVAGHGADISGGQGAVTSSQQAEGVPAWMRDGGSYGGNMTCWLISQDTRFAAAVALAPVTNQVTERLIGNIPQFHDLFLDDHYTNPGGKYFQRSAIMHAHKVRTPILNVCGALDRCTPPEEAVQFHNAVLENGVTSVLVTYPHEGHGIRKLPAMIDYAARVVAWFDHYLGTGHAAE